MKRPDVIDYMERNVDDILSYLRYIENELEDEKDHSAFVEKLLRLVYGNGWDKLTISDGLKIARDRIKARGNGKSLSGTRTVKNQ